MAEPLLFVFCRLVRADERTLQKKLARKSSLAMKNYIEHLNCAKITLGVRCACLVLDRI